MKDNWPLYVLIVIGVLLVGCEAKLNVTSKPNEPVLVKVPRVEGPTVNVEVSEMCYDKVVYLVNQKGGMAPKINPDRGGQFSLFVSCP
jgi:hypothetical protein